MGLLKNISQMFGSHASVQLLPLGSITMDRNGELITTTVASGYPRPLLREIGRNVLYLFREARAAQMSLAELSLHYGSLHITAREMRGGAVIFLFPQTTHAPQHKLK
jgi:hypothetical protein